MGVSLTFLFRGLSVVMEHCFPWNSGVGECCVASEDIGDVTGEDGVAQVGFRRSVSKIPQVRLLAQTCSRLPSQVLDHNANHRSLHFRVNIINLSSLTPFRIQDTYTIQL